MIVTQAELNLIPVTTRIPYQFGNQSLTEVTCARVKITAHNNDGTTSSGWGETPLSVPWVWPSQLTFEERERRLISFCQQIAHSFSESLTEGHPLVIGHRYQQEQLPKLLEQEKEKHPESEHMPHLAALVCLSAFDLALYDAFGQLHQVEAFEILNQKWLGKHDLATFLEPSDRFAGKYPADYLSKRLDQLPVWHSIGGSDPLHESDLTGNEPNDNYPVLLRDWIRTDGLNCLKIKLRGNDSDWDYQRLVTIGKIALDETVEWLTTDFNCTVSDPDYVNEILDKLAREHPPIHNMILYVEQPFPYDLEAHQIDVHSVSARKPLFMDESAHDWKFVRMGLELGWTGVALKTCKTLTGALLSLCWAKEHGMTLMVQDLTNPMLAQIPHVLLAAHAGTIMGVESNAMQFYPDASQKEAAVHPGLYHRKEGILDLSTLKGPGFGYGEAV